MVFGFVAAVGIAAMLLDLGEVFAGRDDLLVAECQHQRTADLGVLLVGHAGDAVGQEIGALGRLLGGRGFRLIGGEAGEGEQGGEDEEGGAHAVWVREMMTYVA